MESTTVQMAHSPNDLCSKLPFALTHGHDAAKLILFSSPPSFEDCTSGTLALDNLGYSTDDRWLWHDQAGLIGLSLVFLVITYINLLTIKKLK